MSDEFEYLIHTCRKLPRMEAIKLVNEFTNMEIDYVEEPEGRDDWKKAYQTIQDGHGECEDIAILKGWLLRQLGIGFIMSEMKKPRSKKTHIVLLTKGEYRPFWWMFWSKKRYEVRECMVVLDIFKPVYRLTDYSRQFLTGNEFLSEYWFK